MMNKSILATALVVAMVVLTVVAMSADRTDAEVVEYEGYDLDLSGATNLSTVVYGDINYVVVKEANASQYAGFTFYYSRIIVDCETISSNAFRNSTVVEVIFTENVKTIPSNAFYDCRYLTSIEFLGDSDVVIEKNAFGECSRLGYIDLRSYGSIDDEAFPADCSAAIGVYEGGVAPSVSSGITLYIPDDERILLVRYISVSDHFDCYYVGHGLLRSTLDDGSDGTWSTKTLSNNLGEVYQFYPPSTGAMTIGYVEVSVSYGGACGFEDETHVMSDYEVQLRTPSTEAVANGFEWRTVSGASVGTTLSVDEVKDLGTEISLTAWIEGFTVSFDAGDLPDVEEAALPDALTCGIGSVYPGCADTEHYEFVGWTIDGTAVLNAGDEVTRYEDHTASAVWTPKADCVYSVTYLNCDGTAASVSRGYAYGTEHTVASVSPAGVAHTQMLDGWSVAGGSTLREGDVVVITGDTELEPVLRDRGTAVLTYVSDGETVYTQTVYEPYEATVEAPDQVSVSRWFDGWSMDGVAELLLNGDAITASADATLTASWTAKTSYTVTFRSGDEIVSEITVYEDDRIISVHEDVSRDYHTLAGWSDGTETVTDGSAYTVTGDVTFTAVWTADVYTIAYVSDGAAVYETTSLGGVTISVHADVSKTYHTLTGWSDGTDTVDDGSTYTVTGDVTFTAVWTADSYAIRYVSDGSVFFETASLGGVQISVHADVAKAYHTLAGWSDGAETVTDGSAYTVTGDVIFTAVWTADVYTIAYVSDGETVFETTSLGGVGITVHADVSKTYFTLTGWFDGTSTVIDGSAYTVTGDVTFTAVWTEDVYTVTYVSDGYTVFSTTIPGGVGITVHADVSKTYHTLTGWNDGTDVVDDNSTYTITGNVTFTAVWTADVYTVTYVSEGNIINEIESLGGAEISVGAGVSKTYHTLTGWNDGAMTVDDGSAYTVTGDVTFTAVWTADVYTIAYVSDGETVFETASLGGVGITVHADVSKTYFTLAGWNDGTDTIADGSTYTVTGDTTFTAVWTADIYTVTYVSDGSTVLETTSLGGAEIAVHADAAKTYHTLTGWFDGTDTIMDGSTYTVTGDVTFTAVWTADVYTVTYVSDGETILETTSLGGVGITVHADVSKTYFTLAGWSDGTDTIADGSTYTVTGDVTFTAMWTADVYTMTYVSDGTVVLETTSLGGTEITVHADAARTYHTLAGWFDGTDTIMDGSTYTVTGDVTFTAVWTADIYTIEYVSDGSTFYRATSLGGAEISVHADATKTYHTLTGWNDGAVTVDDGATYTVTGNVTFTAVWTADVYTVTYVSDGTVVLETTSLGGAEISVHADAAKTYHTLAGWFDGTDTIMDGSTYTVTGDVTFTAVWTADVYTVNYVSEEGAVFSTTSLGGAEIAVHADVLKAYHTLVGWSDGTETVIDGSTYTVTGDVTFTAVWTADVYTVTYVSEGKTVSKVESLGGAEISVGAGVSRTYYTLAGWSDGAETVTDGSAYTVKGDVTFTAVWTADVYTIAYVSDGAAVYETTSLGGEEIPVHADVSKTYHTLTGWSDGTDTISDGSTYTVTGDVTFTAVWTADVYTIEYISDGSTVYRTTSPGGAEITVHADTSKTYHTLVCWNDGTDAVEDGSTYVITGDVTFTAVWTADVYTVTYVSEGTVVDEIRCLGGTVISVGADVSTTYQTLTGWFDGTGMVDDLSTYTVTGDVTFTAVWTADIYTVTYVSEEGAVFETTCPGGVEITVHADVSKTYHTLAGWDDGTEAVMDGATYTVTGDVTFTALWTADVYTVAFVSDGDAVNKILCFGGTEISVCADVSKTYHTLTGWFDGTETVDDGATYTVTGDVTFTAVWTADVYTVTYLSEGGTVLETTSPGGVEITVHADVSKTYHALAGWSDGTDTIVDGSVYTVTGNVTFTAVWTADVYTVTYVSEGAVVEEIESLGGARITVCADVSKTYHALAGWSDGTETVDDGATYTVIGDVVFTAVWTAEVYTVVYVSDEGVVFETSHLGGETISVHTDVSKAYHTLTGWNDGTDVVDDNSTYTITGNVTFTAVWTADVYTIEYVSDGDTVFRTTGVGGETISVHADVSGDYRVLVGWFDGIETIMDGAAYTVTGDVVFDAVWTDDVYTVTYVSDGEAVDEAACAGGARIYVGTEVSKAYSTLAGWSDGVSFYEVGDPYTVAGDVTFTAVWTADVYTIEYVSDGDTVLRTTGLGGETISVGADVSRTYHTLVGWSDGTDAVDDGSTYTVTGDVTFTAVWAADIYTVTYISGGTAVLETTSLGGAEITVHADVSKAYHSLAGWDDGTGAVKDGSKYTVTGDVTFTAAWTADTYTVRYVSDGTAVGQSSSAGGVTISVGTPVERAGYVLEGWSDGRTVYANGGSYRVAGDVTFTAVWAEAPVWTVTYHTDDSTATASVPDGDSFTVESLADSDGRTFAGWAVEPGGEAVYVAGSVVVPGSDLDLYPVWVQGSSEADGDSSGSSGLGTVIGVGAVALTVAAIVGMWAVVGRRS